MFTKPTLFILGAGVSVPFGFPSGEKLLRILTGSVSNELNEEDKEILKLHKSLIEALKSGYTPSDEVDDFVSKLRSSGTPSIDTWLSQHGRFMHLGKLAIALVIANAEHLAANHAYVFDDWYKWLFEKMMRNATNLEEFLNNKVTFITFNYDRMLEWKLGQFIDHFFVDNPNLRDRALKDLFYRIVHVHGHLSFRNYDDLNQNIRNVSLHSGLSLERVGGGRGSSLLAIKAQSLAESIRIIGENVGNTHELHFTSFIKVAEKIIFLGFGYDERNLSILRLKGRANQLVNKGFIDDLEIPIIGSAYKLGNAQRQDAKSDIHSNLLLGEKELTCVPFCNEYVSTKATD